MKKQKEAMLTDCMEGFQVQEINYNNYEISFRRWLVCQITHLLSIQTDVVTVQMLMGHSDITALFLLVD